MTAMMAAAKGAGMDQAGAEGGVCGVSGGWSMDFPGYVPEQLFALAADIESYPRFVPWCIATRILARHPDHWWCDNLFGKGPLRLRFHTRASFEAPHALDITGRDGPFRRFDLRWRFVPLDGGCRVDATLAMDFRSDLIALLTRISLAEVERRVVAAFRQRAAALYGPTA